MEVSRKRKDKIPMAVRNAVWNRWVGSKKAKAFCYTGCGEAISRANFECGHIVAEAEGGPTSVPNLRPICSLCNKSMGTTCMLDFILKYRLQDVIQQKDEEYVEDTEDVVFIREMNRLTVENVKMLYERLSNKRSKRKKKDAIQDFLQVVNDRKLSPKKKCIGFNKNQIVNCLDSLSLECLVILADGMCLKVKENQSSKKDIIGKITSKLWYI